MTVIDSVFIEARIAALKTLIVAIEEAQLAVAGGAIMYSLDTGQTRTSVTKATPGQLQAQLDAALNSLSVWEARLCGAGRNVIPGF